MRLLSDRKLSFVMGGRAIKLQSNETIKFLYKLFKL